MHMHKFSNHCFPYLGRRAATQARTTIQEWIGLEIVISITQYGLDGWSNVKKKALEITQNIQKMIKLITRLNHCSHTYTGKKVTFIKNTNNKVLTKLFKKKDNYKSP